MEEVVRPFFSFLFFSSIGCLIIRRRHERRRESELRLWLVSSYICHLS
jgi:hypothetical protein